MGEHYSKSTSIKQWIRIPEDHSIPDTDIEVASFGDGVGGQILGALVSGCWKRVSTVNAHPCT